jgi:2-keto-3-deoxy-L-rhamnonate aldolase RhmA
MGIPAQFDHPRFLDAMDALVAACNRYGVAAGFLPPTPTDAVHWIRKGFRAISLSSDIGLFVDAMRSFRVTVLKEMGGRDMKGVAQV